MLYNCPLLRGRLGFLTFSWPQLFQRTVILPSLTQNQPDRNAKHSSVVMKQHIKRCSTLGIDQGFLRLLFLTNWYKDTKLSEHLHFLKYQTVFLNPWRIYCVTFYPVLMSGQLINLSLTYSNCSCCFKHIIHRSQRLDRQHSTQAACTSYSLYSTKMFS